MGVRKHTLKYGETEAVFKDFGPQEGCGLGFLRFLDIQEGLGVTEEQRIKSGPYGLHTVSNHGLEKGGSSTWSQN